MEILLTKEQFIQNSNWENDKLLQKTVFSNFLGHYIVIEICFDEFNDNRNLSDFALNSINAFLNIDKSNIEWIKDELWKACEICFGNTSYGTDLVPIKEGQTEFEANKDFFEIHSRSDAFEKAKAKYVIIGNTNNGTSNSCFWIEYETPWDDEHGHLFVFVDGNKHSTA